MQAAAQPMGVAAIQQVVAGAAICHCTATMVVTNRLFTPAAQKLAGIHGVELVDRVRLERLAISSPVSTPWTSRRLPYLASRSSQ